LPISVNGDTGGLIGNTVIICGGHDGSYVDKCYSLTSKKATLATHMSVGRSGAASIVLNDNILWVTGGYNGGRLASSEYVTMSGTMTGPDMPMALESHAMVAINSTCSLVIGGFPGEGAVSSTFFYDHNEGEWITGPTLMHGRSGHAAGIVTDKVTHEDFVVVTGGWAVGYPMDSTEILQDGNWVQGEINK
jgi:hypothetical protein